MVSFLSRQGQSIQHPETWESDLEAKMAADEEEAVSRPDRWGAWG